MVLSSKPVLIPETSTPPSDAPTRGTTHQPRVNNSKNDDEEDEEDSVLKTPETTLDDKWGSLEADPQSVAKSESIQLLSDDDPVHLEEEVCRKHLLETPIKVRVEVCVDVATSERSRSLDQGFVSTSTISSPSVPQSPDL